MNSFPFQVQAGNKRFWAAFGAFKKSGPEVARSGVVFRPSPLAGDNYHVRVWLDVERKLDTDAAEPDGRWGKKDVAVFEVWRKLTLADRFLKSPAVQDDFESPDQYYSEACIMLFEEDSFASPTVHQYDQLFAEAHETFARYAQGKAPTQWGLLYKYLFPPGLSHYDGVQSDFGFLGHVRFMRDRSVTKIKDWMGIKHSAAPTPKGWAAAIRSYEDFVAAAKKNEGPQLATNLDSVLAKVQLGTKEDYYPAAGNYVLTLVLHMTKQLSKGAGITALCFNGVHSLEAQLGNDWHVTGAALSFTHNRGVFVSFMNDVPTFAHELGHSLGLPHAPTDSNSLQPKMIVPEEHDPADLTCLMSYSINKTGFCGRCLLRLRDWSGR